jgi:adenylate kinase family enzyme
MKIHIIGAVGSGKTTLARTLSEKLKIPYYELDNVVWQRTEHGDVRRTEEERDKLLHDIVLLDEWIVEGAHHTWVGEGFKRADVIILLDVNVPTRIYRITRRYIRQLRGIEKAHYKPTFGMFQKMFKWTNDFEKQHKVDIIKRLEPHEKKVVTLTHTKSMKAYIRKIK